MPTAGALFLWDSELRISTFVQSVDLVGRRVSGGELFRVGRSRDPEEWGFVE